MTESEQNQALKQFEEGKCHVLVATSVGGEGIDIKQCNIVISYNYTGNEISKIQMAGMSLWIPMVRKFVHVLLQLTYKNC